MPLSIHRKLSRFNWILLSATLLLAVIGVAAIYSATYMREGRWENLTQLWRKQGMWVMVGLIVHFAASLIDYRWIRDQYGGMVIYIIGLVLLVATKILGQERSGAKSWLDLGPIDLQTSQIAIIGGILALAVFLSEFNEWDALYRILVCGALVGGPFLLILIQPDLGSAIVWLPVLLTFLFIGGIPKRYLISMILLGAGIGIPFAIIFVLKPYQLDRLLVFLDPENPKWRQDEAWGIWQSLLAIGSGGLDGKGFLAPNSQNHLGFLPIATAPTDYVFAVLAEEHGFRGGAFLIALFGTLSVTGLWIAHQARDSLGVLTASGICALLFTHIFLNIGMVISVVPITGLPLPLISYGGSFAVLILFSLGVLQSIWIHRNEMR
jgi:rod shape determining protein RodA